VKSWVKRRPSVLTAPLIWLHGVGVGVGEVMALPELIANLACERTDLHFLVTSSARSSGEVIAKNLPQRTVHQYLPLDMPAPLATRRSGLE
jgi:3-deoxy-D-manno-octulosonic-acid transferase